MGINLSGTRAFAVGDRLENGTYLFKPVELEKGKSSGGHPQIVANWRVAAGEFAGAEQKAWITVSPNSGGAIVQLLEACGIPTPTEDFASPEALRDWLFDQMRAKQPLLVLGVVRVEPSRSDPSKEYPEIKGYRRPSESDIPSDAAGFMAQPKVNGSGAKKDLPF